MKYIRRYLRGGRIVAIALVVLAITASAASADPNPDQQIVQPGIAVPTILSAPRGADLAAINRVQAQEARALAYNVPGTARYSSDELNGYAKGAPTAAVSAPKLAAPSDGFDWGDAGIGAGGMLALTIGLGGALAVTHANRHPRERTS